MVTLESKKVALVTGSAGFIGFHLSFKLLEEGWDVIGVDSLSDYYDLRIKERREAMLLEFENYRSVHIEIQSPGEILKIFRESRPTAVIHLAAQAGVRYSIDNPRAYLESNICGTFEILEAARAFPPKHLLIASTSSAYGANEEMPYSEMDKADHQLSFYAATKKSTESMAHSYAHLFGIPITMFRFFTVYGPWGRPDMALFKFTKAILEGVPIDVYNNGDMKRDFTYVDDLVIAIELLMAKAPKLGKENYLYDSKSPVAPFRVVNIGNSKPTKLLSFIEGIESVTGRIAEKNMMPMQAGDVPVTSADVRLLESLTGFSPKTDVMTGISRFVKWYKSYYGI
jgi:UDP-glucuronate 4-epimerase